VTLSPAVRAPFKIDSVAALSFAIMSRFPQPRRKNLPR
jgi:hypothetical protein